MVNKILFNTKGFTLLELLIVVGIVGILSVFVMSNVSGYRVRTRDAQRKVDLRQVQSALEMYRADDGTYPASFTFPASCTSATQFKDAGGTVFLNKVPCDPVNSAPYVYTYTYTGTGYQLVSCLENDQDNQKDGTTATGCSSAAGSYTLTNP